MAQPAQRPPSCSTLLKLLPPSSAYNSPCFPPPDYYVQAAHKASFVKLEAYFKANSHAHLTKFNKCVAKYMPSEDRPSMHKLVESAYKSAKSSR